jgi:ribosomal protein S18 acetylase RimI-like enzyme
VRGLGLGRTLMKEAFRVAGAMGIEKMVAQMTTDQASAINVFQNYGFENEAILQRHVKDRSGATYDLLVMRRWVDASETDILLEQP